jgi:hypothetical protein
MGNGDGGYDGYARGEIWGNQGTSRSGREFAARAIERLLERKGVRTIMLLNDAQQVFIEAWSLIISFSLYQDLNSSPNKRKVFADLLGRAVDSLQSARGSSDAYPIINGVLLPALGDRAASLLLPEVLREDEDIAAGDQVVGLGVALVQPPARAFGKRERLKVITVVYGSRAANAGIRYGDRLVSVDGIEAGGLRGKDPGLLIPGAVGSLVRVRFERGGGEVVDTVLERQMMVADLASFSILSTQGGGGERVGYLSILSFAGPPMVERVRGLLAPMLELRQQTSASSEGPPLVLDLRGNAGGSLTEAQKIAECIIQLSCTVPGPLGKGWSSHGDIVEAGTTESADAAAAASDAVVAAACLARASKYAASVAECTARVRAKQDSPMQGVSVWAAKGAAKDAKARDARLGDLRLLVSAYVYVHVCNIHIYCVLIDPPVVCVCVCVRERERERERLCFYRFWQMVTQHLQPRR